MAKKKEFRIKTRRLYIKPMTETEMERLAGETSGERKALYNSRLETSLDKGDERYWYVVWGIYSKASDKLVGDFSFLGPMVDFEVSFDLFIREDQRGNGYGKEALRAMMDTALYGDHDIYFIKAETTPGNEAMKQILLSLGYEKLTDEGTLGPRYEYAKPQHSLLVVGVCFGLVLGALVGLFFRASVPGMVYGMALGALFSFPFDSRQRKAYNEMRANRL